MHVASGGAVEQFYGLVESNHLGLKGGQLFGRTGPGRWGADLQRQFVSEVKRAGGEGGECVKVTESAVPVGGGELAVIKMGDVPRIGSEELKSTGAAEQRFITRAEAMLYAEGGEVMQSHVG